MRIVGSAIFCGIGISSNMQKQIPSAFFSGGCEKSENDRGSSLLSTEMRKTSENVRKILRVTVQNVLSTSGENQRGTKSRSTWDTSVGTSVTLKDKSRKYQ